MTAVDVVIVGGGPAGLTAARTLAPLVSGRVVVVEREAHSGGIPRHSNHQGYGLRDLKRSLTGPHYAATLTRLAERAGVEILTSTTVTGIDDDRTVHLTGPAGPSTLSPRAVILATGARERPRAARLVPGDRAGGIFTTGQLQQWVELEHLPVGHRAVVVGAEHVSFSAVLTLRHAGVRVVEMVTELPKHQGVRGAALVARLLWRCRVSTSTRVTDLRGAPRLRSVELEDQCSGQRRLVDCDTIVFSGDWVPDVELARRSSLVVDDHTMGPATDVAGRTNRPGIYAIGNLVHPVETADRCALTARDVAHVVAHDLRSKIHSDTIEVVPGDGLAWVWPQRVSPTSRSGYLRLRFAAFSPRRHVTATQDGVVIGTRRVRRVVPLQHRRVSLTLLRNAKVHGGPVVIALDEGHRK